MHHHGRIFILKKEYPTDSEARLCQSHLGVAWLIGRASRPGFESHICHVLTGCDLRSFFSLFAFLGLPHLREKIYMKELRKLKSAIQIMNFFK